MSINNVDQKIIFIENDHNKLWMFVKIYYEMTKKKHEFFQSNTDFRKFSFSFQQMKDYLTLNETLNFFD